MAQVLNQQHQKSAGRVMPVAQHSTKVKQAFSYLTEKHHEGSPGSRKRQSTFAAAKHKNNLLGSGVATSKNATSFVDGSVVTDRAVLGDSRTNVQSVQRGKRVTKGDRKTVTNASDIAQSSKRKMYMMGTSSFNNQVRSK